MLPSDEQLSGVRMHFYTWRHTGASHLAASSKDPVLVTRLMGDTQLQTVMKHYFDHRPVPQKRQSSRPAHASVDSRTDIEELRRR